MFSCLKVCESDSHFFFSVNGEMIKMIERPSIPELIEKSVIELLKNKTIDEITVTQIARNCGITTRTFYNHFRDKNEVVSTIYTKEMRKYMRCSIPEWYVHMGNLFISMPPFFEHSLCYAGQNSLSDTIIALEWEKLMQHIKPEVRENEKELLKTMIAIEYMLHGNLGSLLDCYVAKKQNFQSRYLLTVYDSSWEWQAENLSPIILKNLNMELSDDDS